MATNYVPFIPLQSHRALKQTHSGLPFIFSSYGYFKRIIIGKVNVDEIIEMESHSGSTSAFSFCMSAEGEKCQGINLAG